MRLHSHLSLLLCAWETAGSGSAGCVLVLPVVAVWGRAREQLAAHLFVCLSISTPEKQNLSGVGLVLLVKLSFFGFIFSSVKQPAWGHEAAAWEAPMPCGAPGLEAASAPSQLPPSVPVTRRVMPERRVPAALWETCMGFLASGFGPAQPWPLQTLGPRDRGPFSVSLSSAFQIK